MAVDTAQYVGNIDESVPLSADMVYEGDDQIRATKKAVRQSFPAVTAPVTATHTELNYVVGVTSALQTQLAAKAPIDSPTFTTIASAPTAAAGTATTQVATTAFVSAAVAGVTAAPTAMALAVNNTASISASAGQHIVCTYAGTVTVTLPAAPSAGDAVWITPGNGRTDTVVARNSLLIMGLPSDMTLDSANATAELRYISAGLGWRLV